MSILYACSGCQGTICDHVTTDRSTSHASFIVKLIIVALTIVGFGVRLCFLGRGELTGSNQCLCVFEYFVFINWPTL